MKMLGFLQRPKTAIVNAVASMVAGVALSLATLMRRTNAWRDAYNPLRNLDVRRVVALQEQGQIGVHADLQWTYRAIENSNPTLGALILRKASALGKLNWEIKIRSELPPKTSQAQAEAQQKTLRAAYEFIDNLDEAIEFLALAEFRGFSHLQKHRTPDGEVRHLEIIDQWNWVRRGPYGKWFYNPKAQAIYPPIDDASPAPAGLTEIDEAEFIIRSNDRPINLVALVNFVRKNLCEKDWDAFIEIYGVPSGIVIMPPNPPQGQAKEFEDAASRFSRGGDGALPHGSDYKSNESPRGNQPFKERLEYLDSQLVLRGTCGKLTMLTESGSGTLAGAAHKDTFDELAESDAKKISALFQKQFDAEVMAREHAGEEVLVYFELCAQTETEVAEVVDHAQKLSIAGYQMDVEDLSEKTGYKLSLKPESPMGSQVPGFKSQVRGPQTLDNPRPETPLANRSSDQLRDTALKAVAKAMADDFAPLRKRLSRILEIQDPEILSNRLQALQADLPAMLKDMNADPGAAREIEQTLSAAFFNGLTQEAKR